jgi:hypothetical protein
MTNCRRAGKEKGLPVFYCRRIRGLGGTRRLEWISQSTCLLLVNNETLRRNWRLEKNRQPACLLLPKNERLWEEIESKKERTIHVAEDAEDRDNE